MSTSVERGRFGKLCLRHRETAANGYRPQCHLTSRSPVTPVTASAVMSEASVIEASLRRIATAPDAETADAYTERLIDYVWGATPDGAA